MTIQPWRIRDRYYKLTGSKCQECSAEFFPPVYRCRLCGSEAIEDKAMPRKGEIVTYTRLHKPLPGFEAQTPLCIALVKLDNGARVLSQVVDSPEEIVKTGARVKATVRRAKVDGDSGQIIYGYKFVVEK